MPENALSENIELKLKSLPAESKLGRPVWSRNGVFTYSRRGSSVCRSVLPNRRVSRSNSSPASTLKLGITREAFVRPSAMAWSSA